MDEAKLQELVRQNKISRASEISTDGVNWIRASEIPSLFMPGQIAAKEQSNTFEAMVANEKIDKKAMAELDELKNWFYSIDGRVGFGPLTRSEIGHLIIQGTLNPDTLVWKQGEMADTVRYTADFAEFLIPNPNATKKTEALAGSIELPQRTVQGQEMPQENKSGWVSKTLLKTTLRCGPWVMFLVIIASVCVACVSLGLLGALLYFVMKKTSMAYLIIIGTIVFGIIGMLAMPLYTLWKLNGSLSDLATNGSEEQMIDFMERLHRLIRSIVVHILSIVALVAIVYVIGTVFVGVKLGF